MFLFQGPGEHVVREGDAGVGIYFILEGEVSWFRLINVDGL